jgi:membrane-bound metal-dependent hydrolase YbcI (DUF457 family)
MRTIHALAIILTALALVPSGAHIAELPNKLSLDREQYFIVQQIHRGWTLFGVVIIAALLTNLIFALLCWRRRESLTLPLIAGLVSQPRLWRSSSGFTRPMSPLVTGPVFPTTGRRCEPAGNLAILPAPC